ncbi:hypothetical protein DPMN_059529 [Dreissena polymorpha]|uniref:Uncharacterized protein n=1 Tax=Dreissena polymorpha TaxID=45954 RepID=A0A9D4C412_DREPO|nr:hypothetical protein DPMN_059529 [Dreissena polymorpha]
MSQGPNHLFLGVRTQAFHAATIHATGLYIGGAVHCRALDVTAGIVAPCRYWHVIEGSPGP